MGFFLFTCMVLLFQLGGSRCQKTCNEDENILENDKWYGYRYEIVAEAASVGSTDDVGNSRMDCHVRIARVGPCQYKFQVEQCLFAAGGGPPGQKVFLLKHLELEEVARRSVVVTLSDGQVENIAVSPGEPEHWQNIRRALISAFVLKKSHLRNGADTMITDVHGTCPWKMTPGERYGLAKSKKDMLYCHFPSRPDSKQSPWSIFANMTFIQYLINSTVECEYEAAEDLSHLESVSCHERHAIMLESTHNTATAVQTNIHYTMKLEIGAPLDSQPEWAGTGHPTVPSGIPYVHTKTADPSSRSYIPRDDLDEAIRAKFSELVLAARPEVGLYTIHQFQDLMELMRSSPDLVPFVESVVGCEFLPSDVVCTPQLKELAMAYLQDALVQGNNYPTLRAFRHLATEGHVTDAYLKLPFHSWHYIRVDDPRYLEEVFEICKSTESKMCWLVLGRMALKHFEETSTRGDNHIPPITERIFKHALTYLRSHCDLQNDAFPPSFTDAEKIDYIITMLKTIRNGEVTAQLSGTSDSLLGCAQNPSLPDHVRVTAVEALHGFDTLRKESRFHYLKDKMLRVLEDPNLPSSVKIAIYKVFTSRPAFLDPEIIKKLEKVPDWTDVKDYVVSDYLDGLLDAVKFEFFSDHEQTRKRHETLNRTAALWEKWTEHRTPWKLRSARSTTARLLELPFLPKEIRKFGFKFASEYISSIKSSFPYLTKDLQLVLAGRTFDFAEVGTFLEGLDRYLRHDCRDETLAEDLRSLLQPQKSKFLQNLPEMQESLRGILNKAGSESELSLPMSYLRMFGSDMIYSSFDDTHKLIKGIPKAVQASSLARNPVLGQTFNLTRTIRVIEAYLVVPTIMGLPLNWTTSATLAVSFRSGLRAVDRDTYSGFFHPSAALTFLNGMLLDFPTVTKIGVQANSSAYTSTQLDVKLRSNGPKMEVEILKPTKEQKVLMLKRTNQLIKHNTLQEMTDWDVDRVTKRWCSSEELSMAVGLRACVDQSYADVTHRMKPWFLMAAPAHWSFVLTPHAESSVSSYVISAVLPHPGPRHQGLKLHGYIRESFPEKQVTFLDYEDKGLEVIIPGSSPIRFGVKEKPLNVDDDDSVKGNFLEVSCSFAPDHVYVLSYTNETRLETRTLAGKGHVKSQPITAMVHRKSWVLKSPQAIYSFVSVKDIHSSSVKTDMKFLIERKQATESRDWLSDVVPEEFWDGDKRAWLHVQSDWKHQSGGGKSKTSRGGRSYALTPKTVAELLVHSRVTATHRLYQVNLTHTERGSGRMLAFANFTHYEKHLRKGHTKHWSSFSNLTVPHHSWELQLETKEGPLEIHGKVALLAEKMVLKESPWKLFTTWWHPSTSHLFEANRRKVQLQFSGPGEKARSTFGGADLHGSASFSVSQNDEEQQVLRCHADVAFLDGQQKLNIDVRDPVHNTKWTTEGTLDFDDDGLPIVSVLSHISHGPADDRVATYQLRIHNPMLVCPTAQFSHSIKSNFWQYDARASAECRDNDVIKGELTIRSDSDAWDLLRMNLNQTLDSGEAGSVESMNMTYALGAINVDAIWDKEVYMKNGFFLHKGESVPFLTLRLIGLRKSSDWSLTSRVKSQDKDTHLKLTYRPVLSGPARLLTLRAYPTEDHSIVETVLAVGLVPQPFKNSLMIASHSDLLRNFEAALKHKMTETSDLLRSALNDEEHPLNELLQPVIGVPLGDFAKRQTRELHDQLVKAGATAFEVASSFKSLYAPFAAVLFGLAKKAEDASKIADFHFKQTIPGWAFYYFNLDKTLRHTVTHVPEVSWNAFKTYYSTPVHESYQLWTFYLPQWSEIVNALKSTVARYGILHQQPHARVTGIPRLRDGQKMAAIFGMDHVITFDGSHWVFPEYPAPYCTYLLAHHKRGHAFTLATNKEDILVDYPDMNGRFTLTITGSGEVKLNGRKEPLILPFESPSRHVKAFRDGPVIRVDGPGLDVHCDSAKFFCFFILDAPYQGSLVGMLGNADGNRDNDFALPDGSSASDIATLATSYELGNRPECHALLSPQVNLETNPHCSHHAVSSECLAVTKMGSAMQVACTWDLHKGRSECARLNFMTAACWYHGFNEEIRRCGGCPTANSVTGTVTVEPAKVLEVALLLDADSFREDEFVNIIHGTKRLAMNIDTVFVEQGYVTRYTLISTLKGSPSFYASTNDVFVESQEGLNSLLKSLTRESGHATAQLDYLLDYALDHVPFDTKATRVILALAASDFNTTRSKLDNLLNKLESSGATLYAFSTFPTIDRGKKVFGVRADGLIFPSLSKETYLDYPSRAGLLAKLAAATKGSIYHKSFVAAGEPGSFFDAVSEEIMAKVGKEVRRCRQCTCSMSSSWNMVSRCKTVDC
ncbi:uncharacterized protein LOC135390667 [Ornithodoros turicata]|uniref:uncharacterized protein LOC135390667 n=1 Tax=Ornithodoros turicata TaxID=34597 RepID=UPI00313A1AD5